MMISLRVIKSLEVKIAIRDVIKYELSEICIIRILKDIHYLLIRIYKWLWLMILSDLFILFLF